MLGDGTHECHTSKLPEDNTLRIVIRGIAEKLSIDETKHSLMEVGFEVIAVSKIHKIIEGTRIDMM